MTHIVSPARFPSKKAFKDAALANPEKVYVEDPSIFPGSISGNVAVVVAGSPPHGFTVTNHPKRSWFARVYLKNGKLKVE